MTMLCFFQYFRMNPTQYENLLHQVGPYIQKSSKKRESIGPSERLSVTLRYIFTGDAQVTIAASFRISPTSIGQIINETTVVIWDVLMPCPGTEEQWKQIANDFEMKWQFKH
ncbi:uncharacterized protein LOC130648923 [Hydractinia symbiolongicarpus]|uniref:uncharacterized protein LOC130648923 n=1 Tax=Hydractinia symbiolongicarpus TaxID=13093 RepID=UPI002551887E|nr:uncharacterized protein LOC130648923 [Hydractinia symbiolongicarpus]